MATFKQKQAFNKIVENHGNISKTMREVGYKDVTAKNPSNLTNSDGWKELMNEYLPDSLIAKKHKALLEKLDKQGEIDVQAVSKGVEMGYKIKGRFENEGVNINFNQVNITAEEQELANKALRDLI
jgi:hypothetical protein